MDKAEMRLAEKAARIALLNKEKPDKVVSAMLWSQERIKVLEDRFRLALHCIAVLMQPTAHENDDKYWVVVNREESEKLGNTRVEMKVQDDDCSSIYCYPVRFEWSK